jgi:lipopolysaccharide biosynthesis regulator YciM
MLKYKQKQKGSLVDNILPAYDDPLFSLLIIAILILIIAVSSYVMGNIKKERKEKSLKRFLNRFNTKECLLDTQNMPFEESLVKPLTLLAHAFKNQGEYQKSINLYLYLIEHIKKFHEKEEILEQLGQTYLKAGFLKRAESIFLEILHKHARNISALYHLGIVYEMLADYPKALETIQPLHILGEDTEALEAHLKLSQLLINTRLNKDEKVHALERLLQEQHSDYRRIIKALFSLDLETAWRQIEGTRIHRVLDILWFLPSSNLNFDIISRDETLSAIYLAKGLLQESEGKPISNIFAIDTIISAKKGGDNGVDLNFSYGCGKCKQHFPISFTRCPKCYAIDAIQIKETLAKKQSQTGYSLL